MTKNQKWFIANVILWTSIGASAFLTSGLTWLPVVFVGTAAFSLFARSFSKADIEYIKPWPTVAGLVTGLALTGGLGYVLNRDPAPPQEPRTRPEHHAEVDLTTDAPLSAAFETAGGQRIHMDGIREQTARIMAHGGPAP